MTQTKCDQCGKYFEVSLDAFFLSRMTSDGDPWRLCGESCLCEKAWELREVQPKLSKSRQS